MPFTPYRVFLLITVKKTTMTIQAPLLAAILFFAAHSAIAKSPLTEIVVTAELLESNALQLPNSVSVIDGAQIKERSARHLEDLLNLAPNVNFASGASRGRFIQIRGIGERSEFQEPIINSVGLLVDGIDLTGITTAASTLDVQQVEILRGPQGTLFGANALAGLINVVSNAPSSEPEFKFNTAFEDFGGFEIGGIASGPLSASSGYRFAIKHYQSDGFTENSFLRRDDTSNLNETTARLTLSSELNDRLSADFTLFSADIDNGYDAFSLDNTRQTFSDEPGVDQQETLASAVALQYIIDDDLHLDATLSIADSELRYSYDEDWSHLNICENTSCDSDLFGFDWFYSSFDDYQRNNQNASLDLRFVSHGSDRFNWVFGAYYRDQSIDLTRQYTFAETDFSSKLDTTNMAAYGQTDFAINDHWSVSTGLRLEQRELDYTDSSGVRVSPDESLWGGRIALEYQANSGAFYYGLISRGYKAGGFNLNESIDADQREFETETMLNYELGFKHRLLNDRLRMQLAVFYQDREDIQSKQSIVRSITSGEVGGLCPCSFTDFTDNATSGTNRGLEIELDWWLSEQLSFNAAFGLLDTEFDEFLTFDHVSADRDNGVAFNLRGREQAHAPAYQWVIGGQWNFTDQWQLSASIEAKDDFFFSDRHEERSDAYELLNLELSYEAENWQVALYGKNLTDELVKTRGFGSFGNDPRNFYETEAYNQFAAPRIVGVKGDWQF